MRDLKATKSDDESCGPNIWRRKLSKQNQRTKAVGKIFSEETDGKKLINKLWTFFLWRKLTKLKQWLKRWKRIGEGIEGNKTWWQKLWTKILKEIKEAKNKGLKLWTKIWWRTLKKQHLMTKTVDRSFGEGIEGNKAWWLSCGQTV